MSMTGREAIQYIRALGLKQAEFARLAGIHVNTITKWHGGQAISAPMATLIGLLVERPELIVVLQRINEKKQIAAKLALQSPANQKEISGYRTPTVPPMTTKQFIETFGSVPGQTSR